MKVFVCLACWVLDELSVSEDNHLGLIFGVVGSGNKIALPGPWLSNVVGYSEVLSEPGSQCSSSFVEGEPRVYVSLISGLHSQAVLVESLMENHVTNSYNLVLLLSVEQIILDLERLSRFEKDIVVNGRTIWTLLYLWLFLSFKSSNINFCF